MGHSGVLDANRHNPEKFAISFRTSKNVVASLNKKLNRQTKIKSLNEVYFLFMAGEANL